MEDKQKILLDNNPEQFGDKLERLIKDGYHVIPESVNMAVSTSSVVVSKNSEEEEDIIISEIINNTEHLLFAVLEKKHDE